MSELIIIVPDYEYPSEAPGEEPYVTSTVYRYEYDGTVDLKEVLGFAESKAIEGGRMAND